MPKVSVIIPTYNRAKYVTKAIDSVLAQTYKDYEIILVDDGSADNTREVLEPYMERIKYIYQDNAGVSAARNRGIRKAKGEWVAFLDSDDEWLPERLAVQMHQIKRNPRLVAHFTNFALDMPNGEVISLFELKGNLRKNETSWVIEKPLTEGLKYGFCACSNCLGKRRALFDAGLFDERLALYEDLDLLFRLALVGPWGVTGKVLVRVFRRDEPEINLSRQHRNRPIYSYECMVYIYNKLKSNNHLQPQERLPVNNCLSISHFNLGLAQFKAGRTYEAHVNLKRSFLDNPSVKSFAKYLLVRVFGTFGVSLIEHKRSLEKKGFRRSDFAICD